MSLIDRWRCKRHSCFENRKDDDDDDDTVHTGIITNAKIEP